MIIDNGDFHASAFILGPDNSTVLIREGRRPKALWKFPGGKRKLTKPFGKKLRNETPLETLIREVHEETGLWLKKRQTTHVHTENMGHYNKHYFVSQLSSFRGLAPLSLEYEETRVFAQDELMWLPSFHPLYRENYLRHIRPFIDQL